MSDVTDMHDTVWRKGIPDAWPILVVDDDPEVHRMVRLALRDLTFKGKPLLVNSAHNFRQGCECFSDMPRLAVAIIDVMLDGTPAGLELVDHVRQAFGNRDVRLVIHTGRPHMAPELVTVRNHDINAYLKKGSADSANLCAAVLSALRGYAEVIELQGALRQASRLALTDALTGLDNRMALYPAFQRVRQDARQRMLSVSLVFIDLDDFKRINDEEGHHRGDELLMAVGSAIQAVSREEDQGFRYGGDEFVVVLPSCDALQARSQFVPRLADCFSRLGVQASFGVVEVPSTSSESIESLIRRADADMYESKRMTKLNRRSTDEDTLPAVPLPPSVASTESMQPPGTGGSL